MDQDIRLGPIVASVQQVVMVSCLLSSYIFSSVYYHYLLRSPHHTIKYIFLAGVAQLFLLACYGWWDIAQVHFYVLFTYSFAWFGRRYWWMPVSNFVVIITLLSISHVARMLSPYEGLDRYRIDITGVLMMLTIKLTSFAFDVRDAKVWKGRHRPSPMGSISDVASKENFLIQSRDKGASPASQAVDNVYRYSVIRRYPSLLEFYAYAFLYPGILTGPTIDFFDFRRFISGELFDPRDLAAAALAGRKRRALYLIIVSLSFLAAYVGFGWYFPVTWMLDPIFQTRPLIYRLVYLHASNLVARSKYYFAWMIAEGSYVIIGLGYRKASASGKVLWDRLENVAPLRIESNSDFRFFVSAWNVCTNRWLNSYVYRRLTSYYGKGAKSSARATIITNFISAFWHGFYPGYYLMFISAAWMTVVSRSTLF